MREIKFRAWDGELMHDVSELHFCMGPKLDGKGLKFYGPGVGSGWIDGENIHLIQFTGLHDKNGKEIYEGDILKAIHRIYDNQDSIQNVHFLKGCFMFGNWNAHEYFNQHQFIEVIGNIYENPELLGENK